MHSGTLDTVILVHVWILFKHKEMERKEHGSIYSLRWESERTFSILEEIMHCKNIWHVRNRDYDNADGSGILAYNLMLVSNIRMGENPREIMKIVSC